MLPRLTMFYKLFGLVIESNTPLPELPAVCGPGSGWRFSLQSDPDPQVEGIEWIQHWRLVDDEQVWLSCGKLKSNYLLRFPGLADFLISDEGRTIRGCPASDIPLETVRHLFLDQVVPLSLSQLGKTVLHAGAVVFPDGAVAFHGRSGAGKSTLIASLALHGFPVLSDDCLLVEQRESGLVGLPSYPGLRLWPDVVDSLFAKSVAFDRVTHDSEKKRVKLSFVNLQSYDTAVPIQRVYFLAPEDGENTTGGIRLTSVKPKDAFIELFKQSYHLDLKDQNRLKAEFKTLGEVSGRPLFRRLTFPRDLRLLPEVCAAVVNDVRNSEELTSWRRTCERVQEQNLTPIR